MKRLLLLGTIAAVAWTTTVQAQPVEKRQAVRQAPARHAANTARTMVTPSTNRSTARAYYNRGRGRYYGGGGHYYNGYSRDYYGGPSVSVGFGGVYGYPDYYGYGYGYPYGYGYGYPYGSGYGYPPDYYGGYPTQYRTTTYTTSRYGDLAYDDNLVIAVQERLARAGYYHGSIDGVAGPETRSAIARWEAHHGMYSDGRIDRRTLRALGIG